MCPFISNYAQNREDAMNIFCACHKRTFYFHKLSFVSTAKHKAIIAIAMEALLSDFLEEALYKHSATFHYTLFHILMILIQTNFTKAAAHVRPEHI